MPLDLKSIFSKGASILVDSIGNAIDKNVTNKEEKEAAKLAAIQEFNRNMEAMVNLANDETKIYLADVQSARQMQISALGQQDTFSKRYMYYLASFVVFAATAFGIMLYFVEVPEKNQRMVEMFADVFIFAGAITVINFFFGSSKSSHDKSDTIAASTKKEVDG